MTKEACGIEVFSLAVELFEAKRFYEARILCLAAKDLGANYAADLLILIEASDHENSNTETNVGIFKNKAAFEKALNKAKARIMWRNGQKQQSLILWNSQNDQ